MIFMICDLIRIECLNVGSTRIFQARPAPEVAKPESRVEFPLGIWTSDATRAARDDAFCHGRVTAAARSCGVIVFWISKSKAEVEHQAQ